MADDDKKDNSVDDKNIKTWFDERGRLKDKYGDKPVEKIPEFEPPSEKRVDEAKEEKRKVLSQDGMDLSKVSDLEYLYDIFNPKFDRYGSLDYLKKTRERMLKDGYLDTPTLNEFLFYSTLSRRLQVVYQRMHAALDQHSGPEEAPEDLGFLSDMQKITDRITKLQQALDVQKDRSEKVRDIMDLHQETMEKAEKYLTQHLGEFATIHPDGNILSDDAKLHWAFVREVMKDSGEVETVIWSEELMHLFKKKLIPIEYVAFALRTSPEGLQWIAKKRGEKLPYFDIIKAENNLRELMLEMEDKRKVDIKQ
jgi:hypothetical protein